MLPDNETLTLRTSQAKRDSGYLAEPQRDSIKENCRIIVARKLTVSSWVKKNYNGSIPTLCTWEPPPPPVLKIYVELSTRVKQNCPFQGTIRLDFYAAVFRMWCDAPPEERLQERLLVDWVVSNQNQSYPNGLFINAKDNQTQFLSYFLSITLCYKGFSACPYQKKVLKAPVIYNWLSSSLCQNI